MSHQSAASKIRSSSLVQSSGSGSATQRLNFKYSMALVVSLPIGTPPQAQQMVLDTGSQLSWIVSYKKLRPFDPTSRVFFDIPCNILFVSHEYPILLCLQLVIKIVFVTIRIFMRMGLWPRGIWYEKKLLFLSIKVPLLLRLDAQRSPKMPRVFRNEFRRWGLVKQSIDSGTEYTYLVDEAYNKIHDEILRTAGSRVRKGYVYRDSLDLCFNGNSMEIGRLIGNLVLEFEKGVQVVIAKERMLDDIGRGISCLGIARSERLGVPSNIIGNFHQQNQWVEFDIANRRVGFGGADCSKSVLKLSTEWHGH
ncbi:aspartic proteinase PCS1-like protein [Tanacetum coccineum]